MQKSDASGVDLSLLPALAALLEERNVTAAGESLGLSQPAMSRCLKRLRESLGDELLVGGSRGYALTPRGERLRGEMRSLLPQLDAALSDEPFDPSRTTGEFRLIAADYPLTLLGPALVRHLDRAAPTLRLTIDPWTAGTFAKLDQGVADLAISALAAPEHLHAAVLFDDEFVCVMDRGHRLSRHHELSLSQYLACAHLAVDVQDGGQPTIEQRLTALGRTRERTITLPYFGLASRLVAGTELVATLPRRLVDLDSPNTTVLKMPPELRAIALHLVWHPRLENDPAHRWLRNLVRSVTPTTDPPPTLR